MPHLIDNLTDFEKILIQKESHEIHFNHSLNGKRSQSGKKLVILMEELELTPLDRESSIELLKGNLEYPLLDQYLRHLRRICEGNPLLIGLSCSPNQHARTVQSFGDLKTE